MIPEYKFQKPSSSFQNKFFCLFEVVAAKEKSLFKKCRGLTKPIEIQTKCCLQTWEQKLKILPNLFVFSVTCRYYLRKNIFLVETFCTASCISCQTKTNSTYQ